MMEIHQCRENGSTIMKRIRIASSYIVLLFTKQLLLRFAKMVIDLTFVCSYNTI